MRWDDNSWLNVLKQGNKLWFVSSDNDDYPIEEVEIVDIQLNTNHTVFKCWIDKTVKHEGKDYHFSSRSTMPYNKSILMTVESGFNRLAGGYAFINYDDAVKFRLEQLHHEATRCIQEMNKYRSRLIEIDEIKNKYDLRERIQIR